MRALPIRWTFALTAAALVGFVLALFGAGTYLHLYREQLEEVDLTIANAGRHITGLPEAHFLEQSVNELLRFQPWMALAVFDDAGQVVRHSPTFPEALARSALGKSGISAGRDQAGTTWRMEVLRRGEHRIVVGHALEEVNEIIRDLFTGYALTLPVVLVVAALGGWWVSGRALAPLRTLASTAEGIRAEALDRRVPVGEANDEIRRLAVILNEMLARLQGSFQQARRFAADASHELRTPLTIMHGEIERMLQWENLDRAQEDKLLSLQEEIGRLNRITEQLLLLAQFDAGRVPPPSQPVNLAAIVRSAFEDAELLGDANGVSLAVTLGNDVWVAGDEGHLRRVLLTLLDNATRYNEPGGRVEGALSVRGPLAELRVANTGAGISEAARLRLFERFFRADRARGRGGHGLGLSLAREIVRLHGGTIALNAEAAPGWTEFVLTFPCVPPP